MEMVIAAVMAATIIVHHHNDVVIISDKANVGWNGVSLLYLPVHFGLQSNGLEEEKKKMMKE